MTLMEWLESTDRNLPWLANELGVSVGSASRMARGLQNVPLSMLAEIERVTDGQVTASEMVATYQAAQATEAA